MADETASQNGQRTNGQLREIARDAWAADGFAPLPGDSIRLPGDDSGLVEAVYLCAEADGDDLVRWSWIVLADGRLLEIAPRGCALYEPPRVLVRGSGPFLELVAQDGALVRFEARVRAGTWEARPVRLSLDGRRWRVTSTGTVVAQRLGSVPASGWGQLEVPYPQPLPRARGRGVLSDDSPPPRTGEDVGVAGIRAAQRPGVGDSATSESDVYFTLGGLNDANMLGLGLWATDICLAFGRRLGDSPSAAGLSVVAQGEQRG